MIYIMIYPFYLICCVGTQRRAYLVQGRSLLQILGRIIINVCEERVGYHTGMHYHVYVCVWGESFGCQKFACTNPHNYTPTLSLYVSRFISLPVCLSLYLLCMYFSRFIPVSVCLSLYLSLSHPVEPMLSSKSSTYSSCTSAPPNRSTSAMLLAPSSPHRARQRRRLFMRRYGPPCMSCVRMDIRKIEQNEPKKQTVENIVQQQHRQEGKKQKWRGI